MPSGDITGIKSCIRNDSVITAIINSRMNNYLYKKKNSDKGTGRFEEASNLRDKKHKPFFSPIPSLQFN